LYWTPPYWAWTDGAYTFYPGYWATTVGFYGGIDYGFGYTGVGYQGGYWRNNQFAYNTAVNNFGGVNIAQAYSRPVPNPNNRVAFNGGNGGTIGRPTQAQIAARAHAMPPTAAQAQHQEMASKGPALRFNANRGQPSVAAIQKVNEFHGAHATAATNTPGERPQAAAPAPPVRPQAAAPTARPEVAQHAQAARPDVGRQTAAARPRIVEHAPVARQHFAYHAPARYVVRQHFAYHAPAMHASVARQHFAYHAPAMHVRPMNGMTIAPHTMQFGGGPHMGSIRMGGVPHFGGAPHPGGGRRHTP
jgi:hypothetical protein